MTEGPGPGVALARVPRAASRKGSGAGTIRSKRRKKRFLLALARCGVVVRACEASGVPVATVYSSWRPDDPAFVADMARAHDIGEGVLRSRCIGAVEERALNMKSDGMLYFLTKYLEPRFKDGVNVGVQVSGPGSVEILLDHGPPAPGPDNEGGRPGGGAYKDK